jgi:hypothetical protein
VASGIDDIIVQTVGYALLSETIDFLSSLKGTDIKNIILNK